MQKLKYLPVIICLILLISIFSSCANKPKTTPPIIEKTIGIKKHNPVVYFEIPVTNIDRAIKFYKAIFQFEFSKEIIDNNEMALFPFVDDYSGTSGALAKGETYKPTKEGVVIYFRTENILETLNLVVKNGGQILYPKTPIADLGFVAEFEDTEGNRIALHESKK